MEDGATDLPLPQEFLAEMLAVRRPTVSEALLAFQAAGLVRLRRGGLTVLDRAGLERESCECHAAVRARFARLLPRPAATHRPPAAPAPSGDEGA